MIDTLAPAGHDADLARVIDMLLKDVLRREGRGRAVRERARARYHAPAVIRRINAALAEGEAVVAGVALAPRVVKTASGP